ADRKTRGIKAAGATKAEAVIKGVVIKAEAAGCRAGAVKEAVKEAAGEHPAREAGRHELEF
ncbi:MAG TPA: hypothetical protein PK360_12840, partial [bacterium]|nr:hypothetical protein [bacterium]